MLISDIVYLIFLMILLFIIIYKGFSFTSRPNDSDDNFNNTRDALYYNRHGLLRTDRQANTLAEETARDNRFNDIFFIEPNSAEAARIRAQLEKDDKDLPSYDEVMRMTNLATPTAAPATNSAFVPAISASSHSIAASSTSVNTTDTTLTVPPYTETGANVSSTSSIPRPLTPPPYSPEPPAANCVVLPITTALHATTTQSS